MARFKDKVREYYSQPLPSNFVDEYMTFLRKNPKLSSDNLSFVKGVSKIGVRILKEVKANLNDAEVERLFTYHLEGVTLADQLIEKDNSDYQNPKLRSKKHLLSHASDLSFQLWLRTDNVFWLKYSVDLGNSSFSINIADSLRYDRDLVTRVADRALATFESTGLITYAEIALDYFQRARDISEIPPFRAAMRHRQEGILECVYPQLEDPEIKLNWAKKGYSCYNNLSFTFPLPNKSGDFSSKAAYFALDAFELSQDQSWLEKTVRAYEAAGNFYHQGNLPRLASSHYQKAEELLLQYCK